MLACEGAAATRGAYRHLGGSLRVGRSALAVDVLSGIVARSFDVRWQTRARTVERQSDFLERITPSLNHVYLDQLGRHDGIGGSRAAHIYKRGTTG